MTLTAYTTRPLPFGVTHPATKVRTVGKLRPAGTEVYVRETRTGWELRIPGTNVTAYAGHDAIRVP